MAIRKLKSIPAPIDQGIPEALDMLPLPLLLWDKNNQELHANSEFVNTFGPVETHSFEAKALSDIRNRPLHLQLFSSEGRHEGYSITKTNGKKMQVDAIVKRYGDTSKLTYAVMIEDVTARVELQEQLVHAHLDLKKQQAALIQSSKLAALGEMSAGIAHELNQPLQAILGFSQELVHIEKLSPQGTEFLQDISSAAVKMRDIIKSLRTFARDAGDELTPTSVEQAVLEAEKIMHYQFLQKGIEVTVDSTPSLPKTKANPIQLEQVIINLLGNACDAIQQTGRAGGKINITLRNSKSGITLKIQDNGCGMTEETKSKIFDPFFTTKEIGKGTGLGLSISYGIIKNFGADIQVTTEVNKGTIFTITFKPIDKGEL